ncbi:hypothetical protein FPOAC1_003380 [Fusarium poae]|uniref:Uncharacterized protein n=1 Tax=Fusarium poae TaxID=36050 RepID=A0A1B8B990_FUSPO|nr:hypothetical protein FPOAC1_003380 [Fusarium poae]KAG8677364.1 hypothetical protein FPOAC1_003380 [Fusarium poae]OBS29278.1 hypothetical protein FPOA_03215 [Fusarium poae]
MFLDKIRQLKLDATDINRIKLKTIDNAQGDEAEFVIYDKSFHEEDTRLARNWNLISILMLTTSIYMCPSGVLDQTFQEFSE